MAESSEMSVEDLSASPPKRSISPSSPQASLDRGTGSKENVSRQLSRVRITPQGSATGSATSVHRPQTARSNSSSTYQQFGTRGGRFSAARPKSDVEWAMYRAKQSPGPGEYKVDSGYKVSGGKFNLSKPKSDVDWSVHMAKRQPGPGDYKVEGSTGKVGGGRFSVARPKSALEWTIYRSRQSPGPGQYDSDKGVGVRGGKFSTAKPKSDLEWHMYHAKQSPGPGEYGINRDFNPAGGKFNMSHPKTDVDWSMLRASQSPGPLDYDVDKTYRVSGGRFSSSRPKSALEWAMYRGRQQPGPGEYNIELQSISRLTGVVANQPSNPSLPKEKRPKSAPGIPPEARRKPKPKPPDLGKPEEKRPKQRPSTSQGIPPEARRTPKPRATSAPPGPRNVAKPPSPAISSSMQVTVQVNSEDATPKSGDRAPLSRPESAVGGGSGHPPHNRPLTASNVYTSASRRDHPQPPRPSSSFLRHSKVPRTAPTRSISVQASEDEVDSPSGPARPQTAHPRQPVRPSYLSRRPPQITTTPIRTSKRIPKPKRSLGEPASFSETRAQLSDNARKLFDLAMQSTEFKRMMELYTGVKDPSSIIEKYAMMWSYQPLFNEGKGRK